MTATIHERYTQRYTYLVTWSDDDRQYIGLCEEIGGLSSFADTQVGALTDIIALVADIVVDLDTSGEHIPDPAPSWMS